MTHTSMGFIEEMIWIGSSIIGTFLLVKLSSYILKRAFHKAAQTMKMDPTNYTFLRNTINFTLVIIAAIILFNKIPELKRVGSAMLAGAAILTAAIGFAAQQTFSNIISGIFIIIFKPFRVGDYIVLTDGNQGAVDDITLRHTVLKNPENKSVIIPNATISSSTLVNANFADQPICAIFDIGIGYNENIDRAMECIREEALKHPLLIDKRTDDDKAKGIPQVVIRVTALGESSVNLRVWAWASSSGNAFVLKCDLLKSIKERFDQEKIEIPYPYQNILVKANENQSLS